ncbi:MAG: hypothetical protein HLUCCX10_04685 [Algoriphagus marincola HL-49]|uniref:Uncharacterized protein n=1 Tax=Algoriphagus marincola HL-49 TaxID=1305737 RepID=A0A0P7XPM7_9BACT|nr:MAG: hypothetical protein HLUCCX10_04685 [Algoriphagus marincola HL-49]
MEKIPLKKEYSIGEVTIACDYYCEKENSTDRNQDAEQSVNVTPIGLLMVHGILRMQFLDRSTKMIQNVPAFCPFGHSYNKPFYDGPQKKIAFKG